MRRSVVAVMLVLASFALLGSASTTYHSLLSKERLKEFYSTAGRSHLDKNVHIHISSAVLKKTGKRIRLPGGKVALQFEHESVPLLINPWNPYYKRLMRKKEVQGLLCVKGRVYRPDWDLKGRCFLRVHAIKTYGGKLAAYE